MTETIAYINSAPSVGIMKNLLVIRRFRSSLSHRHLMFENESEVTNPVILEREISIKASVVISLVIVLSVL